MIYSRLYLTFTFVETLKCNISTNVEYILNVRIFDVSQFLTALSFDPTNSTPFNLLLATADKNKIFHNLFIMNRSKEHFLGNPFSTCAMTAQQTNSKGKIFITYHQCNMNPLVTGGGELGTLKQTQPVAYRNLKLILSVFVQAIHKRRLWVKIGGGAYPILV